MGYDQSRFSSNVDEEFLCSICVLVIENPVQTPCEHLFCIKCIRDWLCVNKTCPVDSRPLTADNLSEPNRVLRNLLNRLDIKCDFGRTTFNSPNHKRRDEYFRNFIFRTRWVPNDYQIGKFGTPYKPV